MQKPFKILLSCFSMIWMMCSGCSHPHKVTSKYPLWGEEIYLNAANNQTPRHLQILQPEPAANADGCLLIVHGMNEHSGRYGDIARHFADRFIVAAVDLTAHGLSNSELLSAHNKIKAGATAYDAGKAYLEQAQLRNLQAMRDDLDRALHYLTDYCDSISQNAKLPVFILSHSLGSLVSASYLLEMGDDVLKARIQGIVFSGPAFAVTEVPGWRGWFQNPFIWFTFHTHEHFLNPHNEALPLLLFNQLFSLVTVPLQDGIIELVSLPGLRTLFAPTGPSWVAEHLSDSEEERIRLNNDQYMIRRSIMRFVLAIEKEIISFREHMERFDVPYLLIYSDQDPITPSWGNIDFTAVSQHNHTDNAVMVLTGKSHHEQLFSEPVLRAQILQKIDLWLQHRLDGWSIQPL
ncbi:MAG: alpha/beta fold hydrolase [Gammaproteobacteria bacterium]